MRTFLKRSVVIASISLAIIFAGGFVYYLANRPSIDIREFVEIQIAANFADSALQESIRKAESQAVKNSARSEHAVKMQRLAKHCLLLADKYPETTGGLAALIWAACKAPEIETCQNANELLNDRLPSADFGHLALGIRIASVGSMRAIKNIGPGLLERVKQDSNHPEAAYLLAQVCVMSRGDAEDAEPPKVFVAAADLISKQYANSPDIMNFCECLGSFCQSPRWAGRFEPHLQRILDTNKDRFVRCTASMAIASVVELADSRRAEAEELYGRFLVEFNGQTKYRAQSIERQYRDVVKIRLDEFRLRGIGMLVPEIDGVDTNGQSMKLSEYRGKVVLLSFWATWCGPCMKMIPYERELAARLEGEPFAIVGVNGDTNNEAVRDAEAKQKITWRSFRDHSAGKRPISGDWQVVGWPTVYLIDQAGVIQKRWLAETGIAELNREIDLLLSSATAADRHSVQQR